MALNANLSQRLTTGLTPQLQQAIRLLPMSNLELAAEVQLKLDSNPMLEREDEFAELDPRDDNDRLNSDIVADIAEYGNLPNDELLDLPMNVYSGSALAGTDVAGQTDGDDIRAADYTADASDYLSHASFAPEDWSDEPLSLIHI